MNSEKGRIRGELAIGRGTSRHTLVFGGSDADPNHDAVIRIGGEAPGRRAHSKPRCEDHVQYRVAGAGDQREAERTEDLADAVCRLAETGGARARARVITFDRVGGQVREAALDAE